MTEWMATVGVAFVLFVHCHACSSRQPAGRVPEGALPFTEPGMAGARRREGFGGDGAVFPFTLPAGIGDLTCQSFSPI